MGIGWDCRWGLSTGLGRVDSHGGWEVRYRFSVLHSLMGVFSKTRQHIRLKVKGSSFSISDDQMWQQ